MPWYLPHVMSTVTFQKGALSSPKSHFQWFNVGYDPLDIDRVFVASGSRPVIQALECKLHRREELLWLAIYVLSEDQF